MIAGDRGPSGYTSRVWHRGLIQLLVMPFPWSLRRRLLSAMLDFELHPSATMGFSLVIPDGRLVMEAGSHIGHLTLARGMDNVILGQRARIGNLNWIYGIPRNDPSLAHETGRSPELLLDADAVITHRHMLDCSNLIHLHRGAAVVGYRSQLLTHGLSTTKPVRQYTRPVSIGVYSMVGTGCTLLGGAHLPNYSALGAGSVLRSAFSETHCIYSGVPAARAASIPADSPFFARADA